MRQRNGFAGTGAAKDIAAVPTVVFPVGEGEFLSTPHAHVRICPFWRLQSGLVPRAWHRYGET
jgi:hypothetical protein